MDKMHTQQLNALHFWSTQNLQ